MLDDIAAFHDKFGLEPARNAPHLPKDDLLQFRLNFLAEELTELSIGVRQRSLPDVADALVDLVYVALGTAHLLGLPWEALWSEVHAANMRKERVLKSGANSSQRGGAYDVVKPEGWEPPRIAEVLQCHGWDGE